MGIVNSFRTPEIKKVLLKISQFFTGLCQSLCNKAVGLKARNFIKKKVQRRCFSVNLQNFQKHLFEQNTSGGCFCCFDFTNSMIKKFKCCDGTFCIESYSLSRFFITLKINRVVSPPRKVINLTIFDFLLKLLNSANMIYSFDSIRKYTSQFCLRMSVFSSFLIVHIKFIKIFKYHSQFFLFLGASDLKLKIVTVATEETDGYKRFTRSARIYGLDVDVRKIICL